ncbi:MAG: glycosyltransferase family A protein [Planctomycetota bacterium]
MTPLLSVLIPTRNRATYVKHAIQSALNIPSDRVEVLVSENHGSDDGYEVCKSFRDARVKVFRPESPLPMHENWEFLLSQSRGEWVTFIGDDDGIMPHAADQLEYVSKEYPQAEALVSPRAYYFWSGCEEEYGSRCMSFEFKPVERWRDSKADLQLALDQELDYIHLPQMYSGGFQRKSMIQRVLRAQNGTYFKSVTPDAYSALMSCLHTYRFLEIGVPMSWVGSSPHRALKTGGGSSKDRYEDFFGFHSDELLTTHHALGDMQDATFGIFFYESYLSAFPMTSYKELSMERVERVFESAVEQLRANGKDHAIPALAEQLGFDVPAVGQERKSKSPLEKIKREFRRVVRKSKQRKRNDAPPKGISFAKSSESHEDFPNIHSADTLLAEGYAAWLQERGLQHPSTRTAHRTAA